VFEEDGAAEDVNYFSRLGDGDGGGGGGEERGTYRRLCR
jgi:hypothetical protein